MERFSGNPLKVEMICPPLKRRYPVMKTDG
jgi:hypothetical protein